MKNICLMVITWLILGSVMFAGVESVSEDGYEISVKTADLIISENNSFTDIKWAESEKNEGFTPTFTQTAGMPLLPVYRRIIRVPADGKIDVRVTFSDTELISLEKAGLINSIYPRQKSIPKSGDAPEFAIDSDYYNNPSVYPTQLAKVERIGIMRGRHLAMLTVYPVEWNPTTATISHHKNMNIEIVFDEPIMPIKNNLRSTHFNTLADTEILEPMDIEPVTSPECVYLIITAPDFADELSEFRKALTSYGYRVKLFKTDETGSSLRDIRNFVNDAYNIWPIAPTFVLLVGDYDDVTSDIVPYGMGDHPSDLYYFTLDGDDYIPDMMYGRFCVSNEEEARNLVTKTVNYYNFTFSRYDLFDDIAFAACGMDGDYEVAMGTHQYAMERYFTSPEYSPDSVWAIDGGSMLDNLEIINEGVFLFNYSGHCGVSGWSNPTLESDHIAMMRNQFHPLLIGNCCLSSKFDEECFGEAVTNDENGAVAYIGASNSTMWTPDDVWERQMYDGIFEEQYAHLFSLMYRGNLAVLVEVEDDAQYYFEIYHAFGDPALTIYFGEPDSIDVDMAAYDVLPSGVLEYTFYPSLDSVWVALSDDDSLIAASMSSHGEVRLTLSDVLIAPDTIRLVAHRNNFWRPFIVDLPLVPASAFSFSPDSIEVLAETEVFFALLDGDGIPIEDAKIVVNGYGVNDTVFTDISGNAMMTIIAPYMETLDVIAYHGTLPVGTGEIVIYGDAIWDAWVESVVTEEIALYDSLGVGFEGIVELQSDLFDFTARIDNPSGYFAEINTDADLIYTNLTPSINSDYDVAFLKEGYSVIHTQINVCVPAVIPSIHTIDSLGSIDDAFAAFFESGADVTSDDPIFFGYTSPDGRYTHTSPLPCGDYIIYVTKFGYHSVEMPIVLTTDGDFEVFLDAGGRAVVTGSVGASTRARVTLLDPMTHEIIGDTVSDFDGNFVITDVPYFTYEIVIGARSYNRYRDIVVVDSDTVEISVSIVENDEPILIIDNSDGGSSTSEMTSAIIEYYDFIPTLVTSFELDDLFDYELIIYSCSQNDEPIIEAHLEILLHYRQLGGHVIIESGEIVYDLSRISDLSSLYMNSLFLASGWESDNPGVIATSSEWNPTSIPFIDPGFMEESPEFFVAGFRDWYYYDAIEPSSDARIIYESVEYPDHGVVTLRDDLENNGFYRAMMFSMSVDAFLEDDERRSFIANAIEYSRERDWAKVIVTGNAYLQGETEHGGITITCDDATAYSNYDGRFAIHCPYDDPIEITFSYEGFDDTIMVVLEEASEILEGTTISLRAESAISENMPADFEIARIYPNPANTSFAIEVIHTDAELAMFELIDIRGKVVYNKKLTLNKGYNSFIVDGSLIETGLYAYKISTSFEELKTGKFIMMK